MATIKFTTWDEDELEMEMELPAKFDVCGRCEGHGTHMRPGMAEHAYTAEEFEDAFHDDEDRAEYFKRGGIYDVTCETCKGARVVAVVDVAACRRSKDLTGVLKLYRAQLEDEAEYQRECAAERRMGC